MRGEHWKSYENLFIHEVGGTMPISEIAQKLERTEAAVSRQASRIGAQLPSSMNGRAWTKAELFLFGRFTTEEIAKATGRSLASVRCKMNSLTRTSGGKSMREWTTEEMALLWRHSNEEVAGITGRSIEEVGDKRLQANLERNGWDKKDPAAVTKWGVA